MSPRWIDALVRRRTRRLRVYLGTQRVTVDLLVGWRTQRLAHGATLPIEEHGFDGALAALAEALSALRAGAGSLQGLACDVVLADGWVAYDVVTIDLLRVAPAAAGVAVAAALADVCGVRPETLEVRWQWQAHGRSAFAMAIPRGLPGRLRGTLAGYGIALESMTGEFVAVYNAQRAAFKGRRVVFAVGREAGAQIAVLIDGSIRATRFELGALRGAGLSNAASGVLRERGDDTTTPTDYVVDPGGASLDVGALEAHWSRVPPPAWAAAHPATPAH